MKYLILIYILLLNAVLSAQNLSEKKKQLEELNQKISKEEQLIQQKEAQKDGDEGQYKFARHKVPPDIFENRLTKTVFLWLFWLPAQHALKSKEMIEPARLASS